MKEQTIPDNELPLVSVVTPIYKTGKWALEAIDSVVNQDYPADKLEYIIINDGTPDDSFELVKKHVKQKGYNIQLVHQEKNRGICGTFNHFLEIAKGEFIQFNGDDVFLPHKTRSQVELFRSLPDDYAVVYSDAELIDDDSNLLFGTFMGRLRNSVQFPEDNPTEELLEKGFICAPATMIKRKAYDVVGVYDESLSFEDYDMWLRLARKFKFKFQKEITTQYRIRQGSETTSLKQSPERQLRRVNEYFRIFEKHFDLTEGTFPKIIRRRLYQNLLKSYALSDPNFKEKKKIYESRFGSLGTMGHCMQLGLPYPFIKKLFLK